MLDKKNNKKPRNIRLLRQNSRSRWIIGIFGPKEEITNFVNQIYNYGGTNSELNYITEELLYIYTDKQRLIKSLNLIFGRSEAREILSSIINRTFMDA